MWVLQRITGLVLVLTLVLHYLFLHFLNGGQVEWNPVVERLASPFYRMLELLFLTTALYHGAYGVIMNIHDYVHRPTSRTILVTLTWLIAFTLLITGFVTVITLDTSLMFEGGDAIELMGSTDILNGAGDIVQDPGTVDIMIEEGGAQ